MFRYIHIYVILLLINNSIVHRAKWVKVNGTKYQIPFAINIGNEEDELKFVDVTNIFVDGSIVYFEFIPFHTYGFSTHFNAYILEVPATRNHCIIKQDQLHDFNPYGIYHSSNVDSVLGFTSVKYVILKYNIYCNY